MAEMIIRLTVNPQTGKKDITVKLTSDSDSLPHEHEEMHRKLVDQLIEGGAVSASELGKITIEREEDHAIPESPSSNPEQEQRRSQSEGA